jgi:hypothetical protein
MTLSALFFNGGARGLAQVLTAAAVLGSASVRAAPEIGAAPYPGPLALRVDATDLDHRIFLVRETVPVRPGPLTLYFPLWLPGDHSPNGRISSVAGLTIRAAGQPIAWKRDPLDVYAFEVEVPAGVDSIEIEFQNLTPAAAW